MQLRLVALVGRLTQDEARLGVIAAEIDKSAPALFSLETIAL